MGSSILFIFPVLKVIKIMKRCSYDIVGVCLILVLEAIFFFTSEPMSGLPYLQPVADDAVPIAKRKLMGPKCNGSILLFGDSSCMIGLRPDIISDRLDVPCINFGVTSTFTLAGSEAQIREIFDTYKPKVIVLSNIPKILEVEESKAEEYNLVGRYLTAYNIKSSAYKPGFKDFRSFFFRKHQFNIFPPEFNGSYKAFEEELLKNDGYLVEKKKYKGKKGDPYTNFIGSEFSRNALLSIDKIASEKNVPVLLWVSPTPSDAANQEYVTDAELFLRDIVKSSKMLSILRGPERWAPELFSSETHLNEQSAIKNSDQLAMVLENYTASE